MPRYEVTLDVAETYTLRVLVEASDRDAAAAVAQGDPDAGVFLGDERYGDQIEQEVRDVCIVPSAPSYSDVKAREQRLCQSPDPMHVEVHHLSDDLDKAYGGTT